jgi:hypothetical protein
MTWPIFSRERGSSKRSIKVFTNGAIQPIKIKRLSLKKMIGAV